MENEIRDEEEEKEEAARVSFGEKEGSLFDSLLNQDSQMTLIYIGQDPTYSSKNSPSLAWIKPEVPSSELTHPCLS